MKANTSIQETINIAVANLRTYAQAEQEYYELTEACDYESESRFETYDKIEEQRRVMNKAQREAYKAVERIANLFGNNVDRAIANDIQKISHECYKYSEMVTRLFAYGNELGYQFNTIKD